jgi:glutamyl/glutaminyl-tRNA synthetase
LATPKGMPSPEPENSLTPAIYPGTCRHRKVKNLDADLGLGHPQTTALRWHVPVNTEVTLHDLHLGELTLSPAQDVGDIVVRTRRGGIAYHLASIADDQALEMNFIVRGEDLLPSTGVQLALAQRLGFSHFTSALFVHHPLVLRHGQKLSKSEGAESLKSLRERGIPVTAIYRYFAQTLAMPAEAGESLQALLQAFSGEHAVLPNQPLAFEHFEEFLP